ncbi:MAG TPA: hypothetical protein VIW21_00420 [Chthoniobacterales bacterium]
MKRVLLICVLSIFAAGANAATKYPEGEWIIVVGGPSLYQWEQYKAYPHDHWWANFVRAARLRTEQLREGLGPEAPITWLVYKQGYLDRAQQEHQDLISLIETVRDKFNLNLVWFNTGNDVINYINAGPLRDKMKVAGFEYFGHSNRACFMFDYSNVIDSACKSWLHDNELHKINGRAFAKRAYIQSWGCHTGEEMSEKWYRATGTHMIGAIGKTQFMMEELPILSSPGGKWVTK